MVKIILQQRQAPKISLAACSAPEDLIGQIEEEEGYQDKQGRLLPGRARQEASLPGPRIAQIDAEPDHVPSPAASERYS